MYLRGDILILVPAVFRTIVAILTAPAVVTCFDHVKIPEAIFTDIKFVAYSLTDISSKTTFSL